MYAINIFDTKEPQNEEGKAAVLSALDLIKDAIGKNKPELTVRDKNNKIIAEYKEIKNPGQYLELREKMNEGKTIEERCGHVYEGLKNIEYKRSLADKNGRDVILEFDELIGVPQPVGNVEIPPEYDLALPALRNIVTSSAIQEELVKSSIENGIKELTKEIDYIDRNKYDYIKIIRDSVSRHQGACDGKYLSSLLSREAARITGRKKDHEFESYYRANWKDVFSSSLYTKDEVMSILEKENDKLKDEEFRNAAIRLEHISQIYEFNPDRDTYIEIMRQSISQDIKSNKKYKPLLDSLEGAKRLIRQLDQAQAKKMGAVNMGLEKGAGTTEKKYDGLER
jgi:hypothetical protein